MSTYKHHDVEKLCQRINKIEGKLSGIRKMLENDKPCDEINIQLNSAKAALQKINQIILEDHLDHCVLEALRDGNREDVIFDLKETGDVLGKNKKSDVAEECRFSYKDIETVIANEADLINVVKRLSTLGLVKG